MKTVLFISLFLGLFLSCSAEEQKNSKDQESQLKLKAQRMVLEGEGQRQVSGQDSNSKIKVTCPICSNSFLAINTELHPADRGMDRDFCCHSKNHSSYDYNLWTCTRCGYSNHKSFFTLGPQIALSEEEKEELKGTLIGMGLEALGININQLGYSVDQEDLPSYIKYQLMLKLLPKLELPWKVKADFFLNFAWIERIRLCASISSPSLSTTISRLNDKLKRYEESNKLVAIVSNPKELLVFLEILSEEEKNDISATFLLKVYKASQWDRLGFGGNASELLKEAILMDVHKTWRDIANFKLKVLKNEITLLKEAVICMKEALKNDEYDSSELGSVIYLLGELQRRIGMFTEANAWLAAAQENCPEPLNNWAKDQLGNLPQAALGLLTDSETILISKACKDLEALKNMGDSDFSPQSITAQKAESWLEALDLASVNYHRRYKIDPESLDELYDLDLLKGTPDLRKSALRFFSFKADPKVPTSSLRYSFDCLIPFTDKDLGYYLMSYHKGVLSKKSPTP
jgi:tetratricopeptide (TPR) repeat protein